MFKRQKLFYQLTALFILLLSGPAFSAVDPVRVMNYNLLNYPSTDTSLRNPEFRAIMAATMPDILVTEEVASQAGVNIFLNNVLNAALSGYSAAQFIDGPDSDNALFYRTSKFEFISNKRIKTDLRDINEFKLRHLLSGDTIRIYAVHLKSSDLAADEAQRASEIDSLRKVTDLLPQGTSFLVCGDFNIYNSNEQCYIKLKQVNAGVYGHVIDPLNLTGTWKNSSYAQYHTQSPRVRSFGGGVTGGMDDRFDLILYSSDLASPGGVDYVSGSLVAYGNDGNHYNDSINRPPNNAVGQSLANSLHNASDHIPVYVTINFNYTTAVANDVGVQTVIAPSPLLCPAALSTLTIALKNYSSTTLDFAVNNVPVTVKVTDPSAGVQTFNTSIASGTLSAGATLNIVITNSLNLSSGGIYNLKCYSGSANDVNHLNDTINFSITVHQVSGVTTVPAGNITLCSGNMQVLTASHGINYLWSNAATTASVSISTAGTYIVTVTDSNSCTAASAPVNVTVSSGSQTGGNVFLETMGNPSATTSISAFESSNGFDNDAYTMSGTGDIRNSSPSNNYSGASGGGNVFLTNNAAKTFSITGINTASLQNLQLSFGVMKSTTAANGSDLTLRVSADGINFTNLSFPLLNTGSGTAVWTSRTATGIIPAVSNLTIQFINNSSTAQYRLDDIRLTYSGPATHITSFNPVSGYPGDTITIHGYGFSQANHVAFNGTAASYILMNDTAVKAIVPVGATSGTVSVATAACNTDTSSAGFTVSALTGVMLNVTVFIEGFYQSNASMSTGDSIDVELHEPVPPYDLLQHVNDVITASGTGSFYFPTAIIGNSYYIAIRHRNSLTTWSKFPVPFDNAVVNFSLATP
jgi:hypothetical protein